MYKTLLVDDEDIARIALQTFIDWENHGFTIIGVASNGAEAIEIYKKHQPDLIVSDLMMPTMDGLEMVERLKAIGYTGEIIIISNHGEFEPVKKLMKLGVEDYILKISYRQFEFEQTLANVKRKLDNGSEIKDDDASHTYVKPILEQVKEFLLNDGTAVPPMLSAIGYFQLFYIVLANTKDCNDSKYANILKSVETVVPDFFKDGLQTGCIEISRGEFILFLKTKTPIASEATSFAAKLQKMLILYLSSHCSVVYTVNVTQPHSLPSAFHKLQRSAELSFYGSVCDSADNLPVATISDLFSPIAFANRCKKHLCPEQLDQFRLELSTILNNFKIQRICPAETLDFIANVLLITEAYISDQYHVKIEYSQVPLIRECKTLAEAQEMYERSLNLLERAIKEAQDSQSDEPIDRIVRYIESHIGERLLLSDIAQHISMHPNYVSTYFKAKMNCGITAYITNKKMDYAKELLQTGKYKINQVSRMVGIEDAFYFNRIFKRHFGMPPSQYETPFALKEKDLEEETEC